VKETEETKSRKVSNTDDIAREHQMASLKSSSGVNTIVNSINPIVLYCTT
jgi:hypothetical protein